MMSVSDNSPAENANATFDVEWDAGDMGCGELLLKLRARLNKIPGQIIRLATVNRSALEDIPAYCRITGHQLLRSDPVNGVFWIKAKGWRCHNSTMAPS